jgi:hypothetical protein
MRALAGLGGALLVTVAAEAGVGWLLGLRTRRAQFVLLLVNAVTNPLLNITVEALAHFGVYSMKSPVDPFLILLECAVVAAEALLLKAALGCSPGRAASVSVACNAASWLAGALIFRLLENVVFQDIIFVKLHMA